jgi:hypothetical protein
MNLDCISIIAERNYVAPTLGKRKLIECGKPMQLITNYIWTCPAGHKRIWPPQEIDREKSNILKPSVPIKILTVRRVSVSYRDFLVFQIHIHSFQPQILSS